MASHLDVSFRAGLGFQNYFFFTFPPRLPCHVSGDGSPPCTVLCWDSDLFMIYYHSAHGLLYMKFR